MSFDIGQSAHAIPGPVKIAALLGGGLVIALVVKSHAGGGGSSAAPVAAGFIPGDTTGGAISPSALAQFQEQYQKDLAELRKEEGDNLAAGLTGLTGSINASTAAAIDAGVKPIGSRLTGLEAAVAAMHATAPPAAPPPAAPTPAAPAAFDWVGRAGQLDAFAVNIARSNGGKLPQDAQDRAWASVFPEWDASKRAYVQWSIGQDFRNGLVTGGPQGTDHAIIGQQIALHATNYDQGKT